MAVSLEDVIALEELEEKFRAILPASYRDSYEDVLPGPMGAADLKYDAEGKVAWNEMWATFCDLAMAGGPPHRGTLLSPGFPDAIAAAAEAYATVVQEICRGITLVTGLAVQPSSDSGWVVVQCRSVGMAAWLVRAIVMENVLARHDGAMLFLPAGPDFRLSKEIKNVVTVMAKTSHYWLDHMPEEQRQSIDAMFAKVELEAPGDHRMADEIVSGIGGAAGLTCFPHRYAGWIGVECPNVRTAIWIMRVLMTENVLARRENEVVFFAVGLPERVIRLFAKAWHLSKVKK